MKITILTLFPEMFQGPLSESIIKRAIEKNLIEIKLVNIRDFGIGPHRMVDDTPYGGGVGMLLRVDVLDNAIQSVRDPNLTKEEERVALVDADGPVFNQKKSRELSTLKHLILVCGHYEGFDERIKNFVDEQISIGQFILTGGEIPAMLITDAVARLAPGVLKEDATKYESFSPEISTSDKLHLEYPHYTKPAEYKDLKVPEILTSGNHKKIEEWKKDNTTEAKA